MESAPNINSPEGFSLKMAADFQRGAYEDALKLLPPSTPEDAEKIYTLLVESLGGEAALLVESDNS